jgi:GTPase SAR1 family protein
MPPPEITVLLLGDSEVGKSTFLSYVTRPPLFRRAFTDKIPQASVTGNPPFWR